ncbi:MAG: carboxymuconolactone decarboxylase family protein [Candidatus Hydrogenedentes bacterium]|nr:carboxymuconolactone decarboxylase family protein [Candidatus Hydrogenedentota bacterium]
MSKELGDLKKVTSDTVKMLFGDTPQQGDPTGGAYALWQEFVPDLAPHISMFFAGRLYSRDVISQKQRELCAVASLTVLDKPAELKAHIHAALNVGATREEVAEVIVQQCTYGGVPIMVEGLRTLKEVLSSRSE